MNMVGRTGIRWNEVGDGSDSERSRHELLMVGEIG